MAYFAKIGLNNKVIEVQSIANEVLHDSNGVEQEVNGIDFLTKLTGWSIWKQTSYNNDENRDAFIEPKPFNSWTLNETTCKWESPVAYPDDDEYYTWNEENQTWEIFE